jgi:hypothetical protein
MYKELEEVKLLLASEYDLYEFMDILELGPEELVELLTDYIKEHLDEINDRLQNA